MNNEVNIIKQFPPLTDREVEDTIYRLKERFGYEDIPKDYIDFLKENNGCIFSPNDEEKGVFFPVNLPFVEKAPVAGIFGVWQEKFRMCEPLHNDWPELFASNENSKENFDVLPDNMMSFAYEGESSGSLFAISTDHRDFGHVYYYFDDYFYTIMGRKRMIEKYGFCFYDKIIIDILDKYKIDTAQFVAQAVKRRLDADSIINRLGDIDKNCRFELSRVAFVPIASSFKDFLEKIIVA